MPNIRSTITAHNTSTIKKAQTNTENTKKECNCRNSTECPLEKKCLTESVIYQATVKSNNRIETYIGLTENAFKTRYRNHTASFRNVKHRNATELSKYIWTLKDNNETYEIKWKVIKKAKSYSNAAKRCNLCLTEKYYILCKPDLCTLNKRNELASGCRHRNKYLLEFV